MLLDDIHNRIKSIKSIYYVKDGQPILDEILDFNLVKPTHKILSTNMKQFLKLVDIY